MSDEIWLLLVKKLTKEASAAEIRELDSYFDEHPEARRIEGELLPFWNSQADSPQNNEKLFANHLKRLKASNPEFGQSGEWKHEPSNVLAAPKNSSLKFRKYLSVAAILFVIISMAMWVVKSNFWKNGEDIYTTKPIINEIQTRPGSRSKVVLPDGSEVWVNATSRITYQPGFGQSHRKVQLNGEAYFQVSKNKELPFQIETKRITITVTGTIFNVRAYDDEDKAETSLFEGSVQVKQHKDPEKNYLLKPNQKLIIDESNTGNEIKGKPLVKISSTQPYEPEKMIAPVLTEITYDHLDSMALETSWLFSTLAFRDESFLELSFKMEKWYGMEILFESRQLETIRFTGRFTTETIEEALEALQFTAHFKFRKKDNRISIY